MPAPKHAVSTSRGPIVPGMLAVALGWTIIVTASYFWGKHDDELGIRRLAVEHARSHLEKDILIRRWVAGHGGVYVPRSEKTPPNPYLGHFAQRDVKTTEGQALTLVNPAYMTRQIYELARLEKGVHGHITSLRPLRPENAPDPWEAEALRRFEAGEREVNAVVVLDGLPYLRHMQPLHTEPTCLQCHEHQGYREGDIRGGISVAVPYAPYETMQAEDAARRLAAHFSIGLLGLLGIGLSGHRMAKSEAKLRESLAETHRLSNRDALLAALNEGVICVDRAGLIAFANPAALRILGYEAGGLVGRSAHATLHHHHLDGRPFPAEDCPMHRSMAEAEPYDTEGHMFHADGHAIPVQSAGRPVVENGRVIGEVVAFHDISERLNAQKALQLSAKRLQEAQHLAKIGNWELDLINNQLHWSDEVFRIFEIDPQRFAATYEGFVAAIHPDDRAMVDAAYRASLSNGTPYEITHRLRMADGRVKHVRERCRTDFDLDGKPVRSIGTVQDVTESKRAEEALLAAKREVDALNATLEQRVAAAVAELEATHRSLLRAHEQLTRAETMASLGRMGAMIAHELNTPIGNTRLTATTLRDRIGEFEEQVARGLRKSDLTGFLELMKAGTELLDAGLDRAARLIASFKQLAVDQASNQRRRFSIAELIDEVAPAIGPSVRDAGCELEWSIEPGIVLDSYPGGVSLVLIHLVGNAIEHAFAGRAPGRILVRVTHDARECATTIAVADDGVGIPPADRDKIFEPFFTTRMGQGYAGLGLSVVYNTVSLILGGKIEVACAPDQGTTFTVTLPDSAPDRDAVTCAADPSRPPQSFTQSTQ